MPKDTHTPAETIPPDATADDLVCNRTAAARNQQHNELFFRSLIETIPDPVWLKDADGVYLACNPMFERFFGARESDIVGRTDYDFVDRQLADLFRANDLAAIAAGKSVINEEWVTCAEDGRRALMRTTKTPMLDPDGQLVGVLGITRDITEFKRNEALLTANNKTLELMARGRPLAETLDNIVFNIESQAPGMLCVILLLDADGRHLRHAAGRGVPDGFVRAVEHMAIGPDSSPCNAAASNRKSIFIQDLTQDARWLEYRELAFIHDLRASWIIPILSDTDSVLGIFAAYRREPHALTDIERRLVENATWLAGVAIKRAQDEAARTASEARFNQLASLSMVGIFQTDAAGNCIYLNPRCYEIMGLTADQAAGQGWSQALHPDDREKIVSAWSRAVRDAAPFEDEYRFRTPDGRETWVVGQAIAQRDEEGNISGFIGTLIDLTERKMAEQAIRDSYEQSPVAYQSLNEEGKILNVNPAWLSMLGYRLEEVVGRSIGEFIAPDQVGLLKECFPLFKKNGSIHAAEFDFLSKGREKVTVSLDGRIGYDSNGNFKQTHCVLHNITERKHIELLLNARLNELHRWHEVTLGRETRVISLKREVNSLLGEMGRAPRYSSVELGSEAE